MAYRRGDEPKQEFLPFTHPLRFLLTHSKVARNTKALVQHFGQQLSNYPRIYEPILNSIDQISELFVEALKSTLDPSQLTVIIIIYSCCLRAF